MESWSYIPEGKSLWFPDEIDLPVDAFARSRKPLMEWDIRSSCNFDNHGLVSDGEAIESMEFVELGFPDMMRKPFHGNSNVGFLGGEIGMESNKRVASPTRLIMSNFSSGKEEFRSTLLSPRLESNSQESSLIDLKLGRLAESKDTQNDNFLKEISSLSSAGSPVLGKRARMMNSYSQTPFCQVQGCNKDLSTSKEYHKRHKVCDAHSKTPKVIVNGIEKRFCQQCSRFHLLAEFDDGKRSCRKRLAGHNERRRKPQLDTLSGKPHKLLQSYQGTRFLGTSLTKITPFLFPDILPGSNLYPEKYEQANRDQKLKEESIYSPQMAIRLANGQFLPKSFLHLRGVGEQYSSVTPLGIEDCSVFDTSTTIQDFPGVSSSSCALSLLSAQSQDSSSHSAETPTAHPHIIQGSSATHCIGHIFDKPYGVSSLEKETPNGFYSSDMYSKEMDKMGLMLSDVGHATDFEVQRDGKFQGANFLNAKHSLSPEYGSTVDLFQLSSHLQRVERQRNFMQVKHENEDFFCFQTT